MDLESTSELRGFDSQVLTPLESDQYTTTCTWGWNVLGCPAAAIFVIQFPLLRIKKEIILL